MNNRLSGLREQTTFKAPEKNRLAGLREQTQPSGVLDRPKDAFDSLGQPKDELEEAIRRYETTPIEKPPKLPPLRKLPSLPDVNDWWQMPTTELSPRAKNLLEIPPLTGKPQKVFEAPTEYLRTKEVPEILGRKHKEIPTASVGAMWDEPGDTRTMRERLGYGKPEVHPIFKSIREMVAPTTPYTEKEAIQAYKDIPRALENAGVNVLTLGGLAAPLMGLKPSELRAALREDAEELAGFAPALSPALGETTLLAVEWGYLYPKLFKAVGAVPHLIGKIPGVTRGAKALKSLGGIEKIATKYPRLYNKVSKGLGAFVKGATVGTIVSAPEAVGEELPAGEVLKHTGKRAALLGGVASTLQIVGQIDTARYVKHLRNSLIKASNQRFAAKIAEINSTIPKGPRRISAAKSLRSLKRIELKNIDGIVSAAEAQLIGLKSGKMYQRGQEMVETPQRAAERFIARGYLSARPYPKGEPSLKKGLGKPEPFIKMPTTKVGEAREAIVEAMKVAAHPVKATERIAARKPPTVGLPKAPKIVTTPPIITEKAASKAIQPRTTDKGVELPLPARDKRGQAPAVEVTPEDQKLDRLQEMIKKHPGTLTVAVKLDSGEIIADAKVGNHGELLDKYNLDLNKVADGGFVVGGEYISSITDAKRPTQEVIEAEMAQPPRQRQAGASFAKAETGKVEKKVKPITKEEKNLLRSMGYSVPEIIKMDRIEARKLLKAKPSKPSASFESWLSEQPTRNRAAIKKYLETDNIAKATDAYKDAGTGLYGGERRAEMTVKAVIQFAKDRVDFPLKAEPVKPKGKALKELGGIPEKPPGLTKAEVEHLGRREQAALRAGQKKGYPIGYKLGAREIQEKMDAFKWQVKEKAADINKIRKEMFELVRENLPTYERGKVKVMALLKSITGQKTIQANRKKLNRAIEMVSKYAEEALQRTLRFQILKEIKKTKPKKKKGILKGKYTADIQKTLTFIRTGLKASRDEARVRIAENISRYEKGLMDYAEMLNTNDKLSMVGIKGMASGELQHVLDTIKSLKETGKTIRQAQRDKETTRINEEKEKAVKVITGGKGLKPGAKSVPRGELEARKTFVEVVANWQYGWPNYLDKLSKFDKTSRMYESDLSKFGDRVYEAFNEEIKGVSEQVEKLFENFQKIFKAKTPSQVSKILNEQKQNVDLGNFENADGEKIHLSLTKGQLIKKYMELKDLSLEETFTGGKTEEGKSWGMRWTDEIISAVNKALTDQEKAWGDYQMAFYREYYDSVNKVYRDIYGVDLPFNLFYSPIGRDIEADIPEVVLLAKEAMNYASTINGSLKSRTANKLPLKFNDANAVLIKHIIGMEHFKAWSKPISDLRRMFLDKNVRQAIRQYHGKNILRQVDDLINQMAKGAVEKNKTNKYVDFLRRNFTRSILGAKPVIGLKQVPSNLAYLTEMSLADYVNGIADFWKNPIKNARFLADNSQYFKERWKAGHERDVKFAMKKGYAKVLAGKGNALDWFMALIRAGDKFATVQGGWAKYKAELKEQGKEKALLAAQKSTEKTQPSFSLQSLSPLQRGGSWMKLLTMFQNQPNKYFRIIADNARNIKYGRQSKVKGISNLLIAWVILPCLFQMIADAFQFKKKHQLRAFLLGPINNLLVIGQMVNSIWGWLTGEVYDYEISPVFSTSRDVQIAVTKSAKIARDGMNPYKDISMDDVIKAVEYYGQAAGKVGGLPTPYAVQAERSARALAAPKEDREERAKDRLPGWRRSPMAELVFSPWALKSEDGLWQQMSIDELRKEIRKNTYRKSIRREDGTIARAGQPHKGSEEKVKQMEKILERKKKSGREK